MDIVEDIMHGGEDSKVDESQSVLTLHVQNLSYQPSRQLANIDWIREKSRNMKLGWLMPSIKETKISQFYETELHRIHFSAFAGEICGIIGNRHERNELNQLLVGKKKTGTFFGDISLSGPGIKPDNYYYDKLAYVQTKPLYIPGLTYLEMLKFSVELRLKPRPGVSQSVAVAERVADLLTIMNLTKCKDRVIDVYPNMRGEEGSDLRRLSIALEIADLPPLIVIDNPTLDFDPAISVSIMQCLQMLASKGHIVLCSFGKPSVQEFDLLDRVVLLSEGYTIYANSPKQVQSFFCSQAMGYEFRKDVDIVDFLLDIASGVERPNTQRNADLPHIMQEKYELSEYATDMKVPSLAISAFTPEFFYLFGYGRFDDLLYAGSRLVTVVKRAFITKIKDFDALRTSLGGACVVSLLCGYLQFNQGNFGHYCLNLVTIVYAGAANVSSLLFFSTIFSWAFPFLNAHVICQKLQLFRYEQASGCCPTFAFCTASVLSEVPFNIIFMWIFATIVFFLSGIGKGYDDYIFFTTTVGLNSLIGLASAYMLCAILKRELLVRDIFLVVVTFAALLSGFPFQFPVITGYMADASVVNPLRWTFEGLMEWKYSNYDDGSKLLTQFGFQSFSHTKVSGILGNFLIITAVINVLFLLKEPLLLKRKATGVAGAHQRSGSMSRDSVASFDLPTAPIEPEILRRRSTRQSELVKPLLFMRESSVTGHNSKLSVNVSQLGEENVDRGPTLLFKEISYVVKDNSSPNKRKVVLNRVTGMFDWGKLSMVMGGAGSGKSSLLHILAGDVALGSEITGQITINGAVPNPATPLWQRCAFVSIQNEHMRDLNVRQVVTFAMKMRCLSRQGLSVIEENVKKTLENLHLEELANKKAKTLNPGELKRLSIAEEMVHGPKLLLMDEPLTDVSLYEASVMMLTFREMVNQDRTVVASVHQPSAEVFKLFDTLLLLSNGLVIYYGPVSNATNFFVVSPFGYDLSNYTNPADFLADVAGGYISDSKGDFVTPILLENYYTSSENFNRLKVRFIPKRGADVGGNTENPLTKYGKQRGGTGEVDIEPSPNMSLSSAPGGNSSARIGANHSFEIEDEEPATSCRQMAAKKYPTALLAAQAMLWEIVTLPSGWTPWNMFYRAQLLMYRSLLALANRYELVTSSIMCHILLGCLFGWIMGDQSGTTGIYNTTSFYAIGSLFLLLANVIFIFYMHNNHQVFLKEFSRGLYTNSLKWVVMDYPLYILRFINAILFTTIVWSLAHQSSDTDIFGFGVLSFMFMVLCSCMLCECIVFLAPDKRTCYLGITVVSFMNFIFSGLFIKPQSLPHWMGPWVPSLSMIRWNMQANFINEYDGNTDAIPLTAIYTSVLNLFGWGGKTKWYCFNMLIANIFIYKVLSFWTSGLSAQLGKGGRRQREA